MKITNKLIAMCFFALTAITHAQEKLDCDFNFNKALFYLKGNDTIKRDSLKSIKLLKPCLKKGDTKAQLLMGRLHLAQGNKKNLKKAFKLFKKSAEKGNLFAMVDLGIMYKYGKGCNLNFNKARKWFKKAATLGNEKASYSLGYLYLKGFGDIEQDYKKAVKYFKKSNYPMAKYWLGICYYYGYAVEKNIAKANELLNTNFAYTADVTLENQQDRDSINNNYDINLTNTTPVPSKETTTLDILGNWTGTLLLLDWSSKHIEKKIPLKITFSLDAIENITYKVKINKQEINNNLTKIENELYFEDLTLNLPHITFKKNIPKSLFYEILSSEIAIKKFEEKRYLVGNLESYILDWNEAGKPIKFVLQKTASFNNSTENQLSDEALNALSQQEENFIKLYPNPFKEDLIISYTLDKESFVEVQISDINGTKNTIIEKGKKQNSGKHNYFLDGNNLEKGLYIVRVITDSMTRTRIIVKK